LDLRWTSLGFGLLLAAGCGTSPTQAPVDDRRPQAAARAPATAAAPAAQARAPAAPAVPAVPAGHHMVKRGDTLYSIALEYGASYRDVAQWNQLDDPTKISVGQILRVTAPEPAGGVEIGAARASGPLVARPLDAQAGAAPQAGLDDGTKTSPKALRLPYSDQNLALLRQGDATGQATPVAMSSAPAATAQTANTAAAPGAAGGAAAASATGAGSAAGTGAAAGAGSTAGAAGAAKPEPAKTAAIDRDPAAAGLDFTWPAKGTLLSGFSEPGNKGLDIGGKPGDPVVAAAAGQVLYTGTGIRGFGKLIVIRHDNGFSSVYAHNRNILVKEGQSVARGQRIAELGDTDADRPKLHFEIRKDGKPVDPMRYLPGARPG
jgi:lipoprotein NlpD